MAFSDYSATPSANTSIAGQNIAPGGPPSAVGPALRQLMADGKNALSYTPSGTGAVARTTESKFRERISVSDYMGAGVATAAAIQAAVDQASAVGGDVDFGSGTYTVIPASTASSSSFPATHAFGATLKYAILMKSNVRFVGRGATIKVANNISSRASPQNFTVFYSESSLSNIIFDGLIIDLNASNNYFSPDPTNTGKPQEDLTGTPGRYLRYHQAAIFFDGPAGKADDVTIRNCTFTNGGGVSTIITARNGAAGISRRWRILNSNFLELGLDTYDHSSIFLWCDDARVEGCVWRNASIYAPSAASRAGVNSAIEVHGSNAIIRGNLIDGANRGFFVTENSYSAVQGVKVTSNILRRIKYCGVDVAFDGSGGFGGPMDIEVTDNIIDMSSDDTNLDGDSPAGTVEPCAVSVLGLDSVVSPIVGLKIWGNRAHRDPSSSGRSGNGISIALQAEGFGKISIRGNEMTGFTRGFYIPTIAPWITGTAYGVVGARVTQGGNIYRLLVAHTAGTFASDLAAAKWALAQIGTTVCTDIESVDNRFLDPAGGTLPAVTKIGVFVLAQGGTIGRAYFRDTIMDTRDAVACTFTDAGDLVTATAHGLDNGDTVVFDTITTTTGISVGTRYFVVGKTTNTFQVSLTSGGAAVALTTNGSGIYKPNKWSFGIAATVTGTTQVRCLDVDRSAKFDRAMPFARQIDISTLTVNRLLGVPITIVYTSGGAIIPANGSGFTGTIPGCGAPGDKLEFMDITPISPSTWSGPNNPDWFTRKVSVTNVDTVRYHITNTLNTNADPGTHSVAVVNYPR